MRRIGTVLFLSTTALLAFFYIPWRLAADDLNKTVAIAVWGKPVNGDFLRFGKDVVFARSSEDVNGSARIVIPIATDTAVLKGIVQEAIGSKTKVGILEFHENESALKKIARSYPPSSFLRVHWVKPEEHDNYDLRSLTIRLVRAVRERSVDLILLPPPPKTWDVSYSELALDAYYSIVKEADYTTSPSFHPVRLPTWMESMAWIGLLALYASVNVGYVILGFALLLLGEWGRSLSIILATLLLYMAFKSSKWTMRYLAYIPLAIVTNAIFAYPDYIAGIREFRGVKLSLVLLPALVLLKALATEMPRRMKRSDIVLIVLLGVAGVYYLLRSGNYGFAPTFELKLRDFLDAAFYARPRNKEILGFVSAVLMDLDPRLRHTRWGFVLEILVAAGMVSVVNTFCHFKGPILVHTVRTLNGLWMGGAIALLITGVWSLWAGRSY